MTGLEMIFSVLIMIIPAALILELVLDNMSENKATKDRNCGRSRNVR